MGWNVVAERMGQQAKEDTQQTPPRSQGTKSKAPVEQAPLPEGFGLSPTGRDSAIPYYVAAPGTTPEEIASTRRQLAADLWERGLTQPMAPSIPEAVPYVAEPAIDAALAIAQAYGLDPDTDREELQALLKYRELTGKSPIPQTSSVAEVKQLLTTFGKVGQVAMPATLYESRFDPARSNGGAIPLGERPIHLTSQEVADPRDWPAKAEQAQAVRDKQARLQEIQAQIKTLQGEYDNLLQQ